MKQSLGGPALRGLALAGTVVLSMLLGCGQIIPSPTGGGFVGRTYLSSEVTQGGEPRPLVAGTQLSLTFTTGGISASAGCNTLFASGGIENGILVLGPVGGTEMACDPAVMEQEAWWGQFLAASPAVQVGDRALTLSSQSVQVAMVSAETIPDLPLVGTAWNLDTIITEEVASNVPAGVGSGVAVAEATMTVAVSGCRATTVAATVTQAQISFDGQAFAATSCTDAAASVDQVVMAVFGSGTVGYTIEGDRLAITGAGAESLVYTGS